MIRKILTMMMALTMTTGASAQQGIGSDNPPEPFTHMRSCRVGKPNPKFAPRRARASQQKENPYIGHRRQLVVMAAFQDLDFAEDPEATLQKWDKIFNNQNYTEGNFVGSLHDYFLAQSYGQFDLTCDLLYVKLPDVQHKYRSTYAHDEYSQYMVDDIVDALQDQDINWNSYDWDGDSFVDQLLIIYAGQGMNAGGGSSTIWPHQWWLSQHENMETSDPSDYRSFRTVMQGDKEYYVDCYCCLQEYVAGTTPGVPFGTICHEYSHCFGFPDFYYGGKMVVGDWDLMDNGNYNGKGYRPCGYSAHERMLMGWLSPIELTSATTVTNMPALGDEPVAYLIRNDGAENEYYIVENRQQRSWDEDLPGNGILVFHIDYDPSVWNSTTVSANSNVKKCYQLFAANNQLSYAYSTGWAYPYMTVDVQGNDSVTNDSLTNFSTPAATLLNANTDGSLLMSKPITHMAVNADGLASFQFMEDTSTSISEVLLHPEQGYDATAPIYDLQGRRLSNPSRGLYIQGNKLIIKQ